nr:hypothetical protein PSV3_00094 [Pseudomonas phage PSV3]
MNGHLDSVNVRRRVKRIFAGRRNPGSGFLFVAGVAAAVSVVARNKRKVGVQLVGLRNVQRKFVCYCAFQIFALRTVFAFAQSAFDVVRTTLNKRRRFFVLDNSSGKNANRLAGSGFVGRLPSYIVKNKRLRCNRLNTGKAHIISEAVCHGIAANEDPTTGEQFGHGRKVASGHDKRNDVAGYGNVRVCACKLPTDAFQFRACGRRFVGQGFRNNDPGCSRRNDSFKAVVRCVGEAGCVNKHIRSEHAKPGSCGVSVVGCGNAGNWNGCAVKRLRRRKFARVCKEEALQKARKVRLRKVRVEAARCVKVGNRTLLVLARRVDRRAGNGRKFAAEVRIAVGFQSVPNGRRRKLLQAFFFGEGKSGNVAVDFGNFAYHVENSLTYFVVFKFGNDVKPFVKFFGRKFVDSHIAKPNLTRRRFPAKSIAGKLRQFLPKFERLRIRFRAKDLYEDKSRRRVFSFSRYSFAG